MFDFYADYDVKELAKALTNAYYNGDNEEAAVICKELAWRIANTSI